MKNGLLLIFLVILCTTLTGEVAYAATGEEATKPQDARTSSRSEVQEHAPKKNRSHSSAGLAKPSPLPLPRNQKQSATGKVADPPKPRPGRAVSPVNGVPPMNNGASKPHTAPPALTSRPFTPASTSVRHRNPNPATVGGATSSKAPNTAAINGTHMARKP